MAVTFGSLSNRSNGNDDEIFVVVANVGDSHAFVDTGGHTARLNFDHRVESNKSECERIKASGGEVRQPSQRIF